RVPYLLDRITRSTVEAVHGHHEVDTAALEKIDRSERTVQASGIGQHNRTQRTACQLVPHEPEPFLARRAEDIEDQLATECDPAEVQRHGRTGLRLDTGEVVHAGTRLAEHFLRAQR